VNQSLLPKALLIWIRYGIPKRRATYKDFTDSIQMQVAANVLLFVWWHSLVFFSRAGSVFSILAYVLSGFYLCGVFVLMVASVYRTVYVLKQSFFVSGKVMRRHPIAGRVISGLFFLMVCITAGSTWIYALVDKLEVIHK